MPDDSKKTNYRGEQIFFHVSDGLDFYFEYGVIKYRT